MTDVSPMKITCSLLLAFVILSVCSCTYDKGDMAQPIVLSDTTTVKYSADIKPILVTYCYGSNGQTCHVTPSNQGSNGDYTTYEGLKAKVDNGSLQNRVFSAFSDMPPSYSTGPQRLSAIDLAKFKRWVSKGALNN